MRAIDFDGVTHQMTEPVGWDTAKYGPCAALPVRNHNDIATSVWEPSTADLAMLIQGAKLVLHIYGGQPPVILVAEFIEEKKA